MLIYGRDEDIAAWAGRHLGIKDWGPCRAIGIVRGDELVAGAVFHQYRWPNIEISFVRTNPRWATRQDIRGIFHYPFVELGCKRLTAITEATNQPARAFLWRLGFRVEGYHPDTFEQGDAVSYGLLHRDALRWLREDADHRKVITIGSAGS